MLCFENYVTISGEGVCSQSLKRAYSQKMTCNFDCIFLNIKHTVLKSFWGGTGLGFFFSFSLRQETKLGRVMASLGTGLFP